MAAAGAGAVAAAVDVVVVPAVGQSVVTAGCFAELDLGFHSVVLCHTTSNH